MLRDVVEDDLRPLFEHQLDPDATRMAAFPARDWDAFVSHWRNRVFADATALAKAILVADQVAGYVSSWDGDGKRLIGYWIGKQYWGRGLATAALQEFLRTDERNRPIFAHVASANAGSIRVLEKCGFHRCDEPETGPDGVQEILFQFGGTT